MSGRRDGHARRAASLLESAPGLETSLYEMMRTHLAHTLEISITIEPIHLDAGLITRNPSGCS